MKIRNGFVSNSSSSSFLLYGTFINEEELNNLNCKKLNALNFDFEYPPDGDCYIGLSWDKIGDNETGAEFKARIKKVLDECLEKDVKCSTYSEAWYDG